MLTKSMSIMTHMVNTALQSDKNSMAVSVKDIVSGALDIAVVLGQAHSTLSGKRKGAIRKLLSEDVQQMCNERTPPGSKYLFGDDFLKTGKESKETRTLIKQMAATVEKESYPSKKGYNNKNTGGDSKNWSASNKQKSFLGRGKGPHKPPGTPGKQYSNQYNRSSDNNKYNDYYNKDYKNSSQSRNRRGSKNH